MDDVAALDAEVAEQGSAGRAEAEGRIFDDGLRLRTELKKLWKWS